MVRTDRLPTTQPPDEITALAEERVAARTARDFGRADALKARIEAAGWRVEDAGRAYSLFPAVPPDFVVDGETRYGAPQSVPSVLDDQPIATASVVLVAEDDPESLDAMVASLGTHGPAGTQVVVVANAPGSAQAARLPLAGPTGVDADARDAGRDDQVTPDGGAARAEAVEVEVVRTSTRLGRAAAWNVGLRRARGAVVILADGTLAPSGDAVSPLVEALADPDVAVAGAVGLSGRELPRLERSVGARPAAISGGWLAFRRDDYTRLGPFDEGFVVPEHLDAWWSLALRAGDDEVAAPRHAARLDLPLLPREAAARVGRPGDDAQRARRARRNGYRLLDAFRDRPDLLGGGEVVEGTDRG